jgi:hypothetical protein
MEQPVARRTRSPTPTETGIALPRFDDVEVVMEDADPLDTAAVEIVENDDGSIDVDFAPVEEEVEDVAHDANLAEHMDDSALDALATEIIDGVDADVKSSEEHTKQFLEGLKLLGFKYEERTQPFKGACGVYDPLMAEAVIRFQATARAELLPASGPVKTAIAGTPTEELEAQAERVKSWMNLYYTELAPEWYEDMDQMLFWLGVAGSTFKKVYQDPVLNRPVAPFILPTHFVVSYTTTSLATAPRATHIAEPTRREMRLLQLNGFYRDVDLQEPDESAERSPAVDQVDSLKGQTAVLADGDDRYKTYECHVDLDLEGFEHVGDDDEPTGLPLPYIVTVEVSSRQVLSIRRNWKVEDPQFKRRQWFVHYRFMPGPGFYGVGYAHILGQHAKTATSVTRQLIDSGTLNNFPGGLRVKGMRIETPDLAIGPTEFREVDTGGLPIRDAIMSMPYKEPSPVLRELRNDLVEAARKLGSTTEITAGEGRQDAPVGTTVALMEAAMRVQSAVIKRIYVAMREEFRLTAALFGQYLPDEAYPFAMPGGEGAIMRADFSDMIDVLPVADPNVASSAQRLMKAETLIRLADAAPEIHNKREAYKSLYAELGLDPVQISRLLPEPGRAQPLDPVSENQMILMGQPVATADWQDHQSHIQVHQALVANNPQPNPAAMAHVAEHMAQAFRQEVQGTLGMTLPPLGTPMPPEIQNQIAGLAAQAVVIMQQQAAQAAQGGAPDTTALLMEQLKVEAAKVEQKMQDSRLRAETTAFVAKLNFNSKAEDRKARLLETRIKAAAQTADNMGAPAQMPGYLKRYMQ